MILEADLEKDEYLRVDNERVSQNVCEKHLKQGDVNEELKEVLRKTILAVNVVHIESLDKLMPLIARLKFRALKDIKSKMMREDA